MNFKGVSVITCTNRENFIDNVFENFNRQNYKFKELIIIINDNNIDKSLYDEKCKNHKDIRVYQINQAYNLGFCLNFGIKKAKKNVIAKFDDDDYYGEKYLDECMEAFNSTNADIVGKYTFFIYFENNNALALRKRSQENSFVTNIAGATLAFKESVFKKIKFNTSLKAGVDTDFRKRALKNGFKIYSTSKYNFVVHRHANSREHTWKIEDSELLKAFPIIEYTNDYRKIVSPFEPNL
ncbi:glycosyltransferase [Sporanaerobacter acetigenes]|uniref:Glycosyl transferase family 2 n=1 Tax=Sporanaerobacter acetigenes DSM 13106 TaxID=1123281 RepID=A0A1M5UF85_9FIRM|nr:glycosyltransferase [Sporanaerobacter acetigenes]SHH61323.1 Glycosyl transferase family 2 [Sporanaerobacter acetigenes DSM 13106]